MVFSLVWLFGYATAKFLTFTAPVSNEDFVKNPIRATVAKEAGQRMSTEETTVRPDQKWYEKAEIYSGSGVGTPFPSAQAGNP
jgi:hypothetical protein